MKPYFACVLALAVLAMGQQASDKKGDTSQQRGEAKPLKKDDASQERREPKPLLRGKLGGRSSKNTKESATLGFNGIDPSGKVDQKMLSASPGAKEQQQVAALTSNRPGAAELAAFLSEGGLNKK